MTTTTRTTTNRLTARLPAIRARFDRLSDEERADLDATFAVAWDEHFAYQQEQARAHAMGRITTEEATTIYAALGEVGSPENGGWAAGTDTATKVVVTLAMRDLLARGAGR